MFEGMYYGPLIFLVILSLVICCITSYIRLGVTTFIAAFCYILVFLLMVMCFFIAPLLLTIPQNSQGSITWGTSEGKTCQLFIASSLGFSFNSYLERFSGHNVGLRN